MATDNRKAVSMLVIGFKAFLIWTTWYFTVVDGAVMISTEPCPEGVAKGESWIPKITPGANSPAMCMECHCFQEPQVGYTCHSCGVAVLHVENPECYVDKDTPDLPYPECCALVKLCPGDQRYNASKAQADIIG